MCEDTKQKLETGKQRLAEIERMLEPYSPKVTVREGPRRGEWRSYSTFPLSFMNWLYLACSRPLRDL